MQVIKVTLKKNGMPYYFSVNHLSLKKDQFVIVETEKGVQFGTTISEIFEIDDSQIQGKMKNVLRIASKKDEKRHLKNVQESQIALKKCRELVVKHQLNMKILDASYTFDRDQLFFYFLADNRVDFRNLAKDLAAIYHTRIELRQVGVRDKAKEIGGIGMCGRMLCCSTFLNEFDSVSINMAKNQNISLNPTKINGVCGRLLCCLTYENETYEEYRKELPNLGERVKYKEKSGKVVSLDILNKSYTILTDDEEYLDVNVNDSTK